MYLRTCMQICSLYADRFVYTMTITTRVITHMVGWARMTHYITLKRHSHAHAYIVIHACGCRQVPKCNHIYTYLLPSMYSYMQIDLHTQTSAYINTHFLSHTHIHTYCYLARSLVCSYHHNTATWVRWRPSRGLPTAGGRADWLRWWTSHWSCLIRSNLNRFNLNPSSAVRSCSQRMKRKSTIVMSGTAIHMRANIYMALSTSRKGDNRKPKEEQVSEISPPHKWMVDLWLLGFLLEDFQVSTIFMFWGEKGLTIQTWVLSLLCLRGFVCDFSLEICRERKFQKKVGCPTCSIKSSSPQKEERAQGMYYVHHDLNTPITPKNNTQAYYNTKWLYSPCSFRFFKFSSDTFSGRWVCFSSSWLSQTTFITTNSIVLMSYEPHSMSPPPADFLFEFSLFGGIERKQASLRPGVGVSIMIEVKQTWQSERVGGSTDDRAGGWAGWEDTQEPVTTCALSVLTGRGREKGRGNETVESASFPVSFRSLFIPHLFCLWYFAVRCGVTCSFLLPPLPPLFRSLLLSELWLYGLSISFWWVDDRFNHKTK